METKMDAAPVCFITGCSTDLGRALAERVLQHGYRAVATASNPTQINDLAAAYPNAALSLALDVAEPVKSIKPWRRLRKRSIASTCW